MQLLLRVNQIRGRTNDILDVTVLSMMQQGTKGTRLAFLPGDLLYGEPGDRTVHDEGPPLDGLQAGRGKRPDERGAVEVEARGVRRRASPVHGHAGVEAAVLHLRDADVEVGYDVAVDRHVLPDQVPEKPRKVGQNLGWGSESCSV